MSNLSHNLRTVVYGASLVLIGSVPGLFVALSDTTLGSINRLIGLGVAALWVLSVVAAGRVRRLHLFHGLGIAFAVWYVLSLSWSVAPDDSPFLMGVVQGAILTVMLWDIYRTRPQIEAAMQAFLLGGYVSVGTTLMNFLQGHQARHWEQRFAGSGFDPNDLALLLAIGIPMAAHLTKRQAGPVIFRALNALYPFAAGLVIILSGSRGALVAAAPAYLYYFVTVAGMGRWWRLALCVVLAGAVLGVARLDLSQPLQRLATVGASASEDHLSGRAELWHAGWVAFGEHPLLGVGGGAFREATRSKTGLGETLIAHNTYLSVLTELGPVGFLLLLAMLVVVARSGLRRPRLFGWTPLLSLLVWAIGVGALSWEFRSQTWLLFGLIVAGGHCEPVAALVRVVAPRPMPEVLRAEPAGRSGR